jgi:hypothetical protein
MSSVNYSGSLNVGTPFAYQGGLRGMQLQSPPTSMDTVFSGMPMPPGSHRNIEFSQNAVITASYQVLSLDEWADAAKYLHEYTPLFVLAQPGQTLSDSMRNIVLSLGQANALLEGMWQRILEDIQYVDSRRDKDDSSVLGFAAYDPRKVPEPLLDKRIESTKDARGNIGVVAYLCARRILQLITPLGTQYTNISGTYPGNKNVSVIVGGDSNVFDLFLPPAGRYNFLHYVLKRRLLPNGEYGAMQFYPISTVTRHVPRSMRVYRDMCGQERVGPTYFYGRVTDREYNRADEYNAMVAAGHAGSLEQQNLAMLSLKPLHFHQYQNRHSNVFVFE